MTQSKQPRWAHGGQGHLSAPRHREGENLSAFVQNGKSFRKRTPRQLLGKENAETTRRGPRATDVPASPASPASPRSAPTPGRRAGGRCGAAGSAACTPKGTVPAAAGSSEQRASFSRSGI